MRQARLKASTDQPVAYYHCISRDNPDRQWFLDTLAEACVKAGWPVNNCALAPRKGTGILPA